MPLDPAKIKARAERLGLSPEQVAERAGMARPNYVRAAGGRRPDPALSTAERIAWALRCKVDDLLSPGAGE